jgi:hypothetical protein
MRGTLRTLLLISAVVALPAMTANSLHTHAPSPKRANCGPTAYGHTLGGEPPTATCDQYDTYAFGPTDHVQATSGNCPIDNLPVFPGRIQQ